MDIYYYCSYTGSPVGYQLGKLNEDTGKLVDENIPRLIHRCFSRGMIRKACGRFPGENKYFLLVKDLTARKAAEDGAEEYYLNIALVSDSFDDYKKWLSGNLPEQKIANVIRDTISLRNDPQFGFTVHKEQVEALKNLKFSTLFKGIAPDEEMAYFQVLSPNLTTEELQDTLGLLDDSCNLTKMPADISREGEWFQSCKKKEFRSLWMKVVLLLVCLASVVMLLITLSKGLTNGDRDDLDNMSTHTEYNQSVESENDVRKSGYYP